MSTFTTLFAFDLRCAWRRPSTWTYLLLYAGLAVLMTAIAGDAFGNLSGGGQVKANAPSTIVELTMGLGLIATITISAVLGQAVHRDIASGMHPLLFAAPLGRLAYLAARFGAGLAVMAAILAAIPLGLLAGTLIPTIPPERLGPFRGAAYLWAYALLLPNLLWIGAAFFALAAATRGMMANYLGGVVLLVGYGIAGNLAREVDHKVLAALLDPFGGAALRLASDYWTPAERNTLLPSLSGPLLANRLLWIAVGGAILALCAWRFRLAHDGGGRPGRRRTAATAGPAPAPAPLAQPATRRFGAGGGLRQAWAVLRLSCRTILGNIYFPAILAVGLGFLLLSAGVVGRIYGTPTWPVAWQVLEVLRGAFHVITLIVIAFYAGELVWQERGLRLQQISDAAPVPTWALLLGKLGGLMVVVVLLQAVVLAAGLITQLTRGFHDHQLALQLGVLFGLDLVEFLPLAVVALAVQVAANHKQLGHALFVLLVVGLAYLPELGIEHPLLSFGRGTDWIYSDMNGFGWSLESWGWYRAYGLAGAALLAVAVVLLWVRGQDRGWRWRLRQARARCGPGARRAALAAGLATALCAGWIFWNVNVRDTWRSSRQQQALAAAYERSWKPHQGLAQPRVAALRLACDLYPREGRVRLAGTQRLANRSGQAIATLHLLLPASAGITSLAFTPAAHLASEDAVQGYRIYTLDVPLAPGATLECAFDLDYRRHGFDDSKAVTANGSFVTSALLPSFGYDPGRELTDPDVRKRFALPERPRMPALDDAQARQRTYIARDGDWIEAETTVTTDPDQTALAPGRLVASGEADGRRWFRYRLDAPALPFLAMLSARYERRSGAWNGIPIEVLYHPAHAYNVDTMLNAAQQTLAYASAAFGPFQHDHLRIAEFPRYGAYAQSFPGTIAFSEAVGFVARLDDEQRIDYPFLITAHEVAHQWWAHQVIGAEVQGATLLSEVLAQYTALMVVEHAFGPATTRRLLAYELDQYLSGRAFERRSESPLALVEGQPYLHYDKGAVAMYALKDQIGEERLNGALRAFAEQVRFRGPPYPTSTELLAAIDAAAPPAARPLIDDLFRHITLWDLQATSASAQPTGDGTWTVTVAWRAERMRVDGKGVEQIVPLDQEIEIGVFAPGATPADDEVPLVLEKRRVVSGTGSATFTVDRQPRRAGIDPWHKLIDRTPRDNVIAVQAAGE